MKKFLMMAMMALTLAFTAPQQADATSVVCFHFAKLQRGIETAMTVPIPCFLSGSLPQFPAINWVFQKQNSEFLAFFSPLRCLLAT